MSPAYVASLDQAYETTRKVHTRQKSNFRLHIMK